MIIFNVGLSIFLCYVRDSASKITHSNKRHVVAFFFRVFLHDLLEIDKNIMEWKTCYRNVISINYDSSWNVEWICTLLGEKYLGNLYCPNFYEHFYY